MTGSIRFIFIIFEEHSFQLLVKERKYQQYQAQNDKYYDNDKDYKKVNE